MSPIPWADQDRRDLDPDEPTADAPVTAGTVTGTPGQADPLGQVFWDAYSGNPLQWKHLGELTRAAAECGAQAVRVAVLAQLDDDDASTLGAAVAFELTGAYVRGRERDPMAAIEDKRAVGRVTNLARNLAIAAAPQPAPEAPDPALVLADGEVVATRAYDGGAIVISFGPGAPLDRAAELRDAMAAQCDVPVFAVADVAAIRAWEPHEIPGTGTAWRLLDETRERLGLLEDGIGNLAAGLKLSADASRPSRKSGIEDGCAAALLGLLDPR